MLMEIKKNVNNNKSNIENVTINYIYIVFHKRLKTSVYLNLAYGILLVDHKRQARQAFLSLQVFKYGTNIITVQKFSWEILYIDKHDSGFEPDIIEYRLNLTPLCHVR